MISVTSLILGNGVPPVPLIWVSKQSAQTKSVNPIRVCNLKLGQQTCVRHQTNQNIEILLGLTNSTSTDWWDG